MEEYKVVGLMSGTSLDGLDLAYCHYTKAGGKWKFNLQKAMTVAYPNVINQQLSIATNLSGLELSMLDLHLGQWYGDRVKEFIESENLDVDLVASHGHTIFHQPETGLTTQIGSGIEIMNRCRLPVINDFRSLDVSLGGQGAPLVPIGDKLLFSDYDFCLNLGGIANISFDKEKLRRAFDIGPCNILLNHIAKRFDMAYDKDGRIAQSGSINYDLLKDLNNLHYYSKSYPKTLGYEWIDKNILSTIDAKQISDKDLLATFTEHIANQIAINVNKMTQRNARMLLTGGGAFNKFLIASISQKLDKAITMKIPVPKIISFKEAIIFGFLGVLRLRKEHNCLASVTGAKEDSCSGNIYTPISS